MRREEGRKSKPSSLSSLSLSFPSSNFVYIFFHETRRGERKGEFHPEHLLTLLPLLRLFVFLFRHITSFLFFFFIAVLPSTFFEITVIPVVYGVVVRAVIVNGTFGSTVIVTTGVTAAIHLLL